MTDSLTGQVSTEVLALHGRLRLLRGHRNKEAQRLRSSIEMMHTLLLKSLRGLDAKDYSTPVDNITMRRVYRELRVSEKKIAEMDAEWKEVSDKLVSLT